MVGVLQLRPFLIRGVILASFGHVSGLFGALVISAWIARLRPKKAPAMILGLMDNNQRAAGSGVAGQLSRLDVRIEEPRRARVDHHLLVAIPALNEEATLGEVLRSIPSEVPDIASIRALVVDDGSTDRTATIARDCGATVVQHASVRGVGSAFQSALAYALANGFDMMVTLDGDGQFDPRSIPQLIAPVTAGDADVALASRFMDPNLVPEMPTIKRWGNQVLSRLISHLSGQQFHDVSCGLRCYNRRAMLRLNAIARFTYTQEVLLNLSFKGLALVEVPTRVLGVRPVGESRVARSVWRYGWRAGRIILRCYRDYYPLRFFGLGAALLFGLATLLGAFLGLHYLETGRFSPHKWAGFTAGALASFGVLSLHLAVIGDMMTRHRSYLEELLFLNRDRTASAPNNGDRPREVPP